MRERLRIVRFFLWREATGLPLQTFAEMSDISRKEIENTEIGGYRGDLYLGAAAEIINTFPDMEDFEDFYEKALQLREVLELPPEDPGPAMVETLRRRLREISEGGAYSDELYHRLRFKRTTDYKSKHSTAYDLNVPRREASWRGSV